MFRDSNQLSLCVRWLHVLESLQPRAPLPGGRAFLLLDESHPIVFQAPWSEEERLTPSEKIFPCRWELIAID